MLVYTHFALNCNCRSLGQTHRWHRCSSSNSPIFPLNRKISCVNLTLAYTAGKIQVVFIVPNEQRTCFPLKQRCGESKSRKINLQLFNNVNLSSKMPLAIGIYSKSRLAPTHRSNNNLSRIRNILHDRPHHVIYSLMLHLRIIQIPTGKWIQNGCDVFIDNKTLKLGWYAFLGPAAVQHSMETGERNLLGKLRVCVNFSLNYYLMRTAFRMTAAIIFQSFPGTKRIISKDR